MLMVILEVAHVIIESVGFTSRREGRTELQTALSFLLGPTRVESGCLACHLYQDVGNSNRFHFECTWKTEEHLIRHLRSEIFRRILILMELSAEPPSVQFHTVLETRGMEVIHAARREERVQLSDDPIFGVLGEGPP